MMLPAALAAPTGTESGPPSVSTNTTPAVATSIAGASANNSAPKTSAKSSTSFASALARASITASGLHGVPTLSTSGPSASTAAGNGAAENGKNSSSPAHDQASGITTATSPSRQAATQSLASAAVNLNKELDNPADSSADGPASADPESANDASAGPQTSAQMPFTAVFAKLSAEKTSAAETALNSESSSESSNASPISVTTSIPDTAVLPGSAAPSDIPGVARHQGPEKQVQPTGGAKADSSSTPRSVVGTSQPALPVTTGAIGTTASTVSAAEQVSRAVLGQSEVLKQQGQVTLQLKLDPPGLGPVRVQLSSSGQNVSARVVVEVQATQHVLQSQQHDLRDRLTQAGMSLDRFEVHYQQREGQQQQHSPGDEQTDQEASGPRSSAMFASNRSASAQTSAIDLVA